MDDGNRALDMYFDFISPYSWLAMTQVEEFSRKHRVQVNLQPVALGVLLTASGLVGPAEVEVKRRYTFVDVVRSARAMGLEVVGPPTHPFRSLDALRLVTSELGSGRDPLPLALALFDACWAKGRDLTELATLVDVARLCGIDADSAAERILSTGVKDALKASTKKALSAGVFGVPTFAYRTELFWGHDRMGQLADALQTDRPPLALADVEFMLQRPRGVDRKQRPPG